MTTDAIPSSWVETFQVFSLNVPRLRLEKFHHVHVYKTYDVKIYQRMIIFRCFFADYILLMLQMSHIVYHIPLYRVALPTRIQKFTVLKSPHIYKKHRVQYEMRNHSRLVQVYTKVVVHVYLHVCISTSLSDKTNYRNNS